MVSQTKTLESLKLKRGKARFQDTAMTLNQVNNFNAFTSFSIVIACKDLCGSHCDTAETKESEMEIPSRLSGYKSDWSMRMQVQTPRLVGYGSGVDVSCGVGLRSS